MNCDYDYYGADYCVGNVFSKIQLSWISQNNFISISVDNTMNEILNEKITNKSKYIEWLIYQDLKKSRPEDDRLKNLYL